MQSEAYVHQSAANVNHLLDEPHPNGYCVAFCYRSQPLRANRSPSVELETRSPTRIVTLKQP